MSFKYSAFTENTPEMREYLEGLGLAIGKEYGDHKAKGNHWCWYDILADLLGVIAGGAIYG